VAALEAAGGIKKAAPQQWNNDQLRAVLAAARILLEYTDDGFAKAERLLAPAVEQARDAPDEWKASAQALLVFAIAAQGRIEDAQRHVEGLAGAGPQALQTLVEGLDRASGSAQPSLRKNLATLELRVIELIGERSAGDNDAERHLLALARTRALSAAGRHDEAIAELRKLAEDNPRDGRIHEALAVALWQANDPAALDAWQSIERKSRSGSERWLRAKLHEALIYERIGQPERAVQAVNLVKRLYPEMGGPEFKQQFVELLNRLQQGGVH
jgi:tetratricopeptide (TPR) repeat protein